MNFQKLSAVMILIALACLGVEVIAKQPKKAGLCSLSQQPGFMNSWAGQPGTPDHSESRTIKAGAWMGCWAEAAQGSSVPPACFLSYQNGGQYTLPSRNAMDSPSSDVVTLSCNGTQPTCCKVQVAGSLAELQKKMKDMKAVQSKDIKK